VPADGAAGPRRAIDSAQKSQPAPADSYAFASTNRDGAVAFVTTHWSVVLAAQGESSAADEALEKLCRAYWRPLYGFVRRQGAGPEEAQDLTQGFFAHSWGFQVIDGANRNVLQNNAAANNSVYDVEFAGDSTRYGFFTPASFNNVFKGASQKGLVVKDCGNNNTIKGKGTLVDQRADPWF